MNAAKLAALLEIASAVAPGPQRDAALAHVVGGVDRHASRDEAEGAAGAMPRQHDHGPVGAGREMRTSAPDLTHRPRHVTGPQEPPRDEPAYGHQIRKYPEGPQGPAKHAEPPHGPPRPGLVPQSGDAAHPRHWVRPDHAGGGAAPPPKRPGGTAMPSAPPKKPPKARASRGDMVAARRVGEGKDAKVILEGGVQAPPHVTPAMVGADWTGVKVAADPHAEVVVTGRDKNGRAKTVYSDAFHMKQAAVKFARTRDGLVQAREMHGQAVADSADPAKKEQADCCRLMMEQATRPGSDADNKGTAKLFGHPVTTADVSVDGDKVTLNVGGQAVPVKDKKARAELARRVQNHEPLFDSGYWLKSHGATTLEGRHVVERDGHVFLEFMGKESVWHSHRVQSPDTARMLLDRKEAAGDTGRLFKTDDKKVREYAATLDGGKFTPKDFRTQKATSMAADMVRSMPRPADEKARKKAIMDVAGGVSRVLGNEAAQALASYIAPEVFSVWS